MSFVYLCKYITDNFMKKEVKISIKSSGLFYFGKVIECTPDYVILKSDVDRIYLLHNISTIESY